ncbi:MAG TPA: putative Ig domain-containing protein [Nitrospira sp.]|nr:putative Ig domain-containing protein [Nitrospira sp.]
MCPGSVAETNVTREAQRARGATPRARRDIWLVWLLLPLSVMLPGCQRGDVGVDHPNTKLGSGNHPPVVRAATLHPTPLVLTGPILVHVDAQDIDLNPLSFRYQWIVNGQPLRNQNGERLPPEVLKRGDAVSVEVRPHDGLVEGRSFTSEPLVVGNSPPIVSRLAIEPESAFPGIRVQARADLSDADRDMIRVSYRWWKNDVLVQEGDEAELDTNGFSRGDTLSVEAVPFDGVEKGTAVRSVPIRVGNSPPRFLSAPAQSIVNNRYDYHVEAMDAESDPIIFSLETAPPGMTIDESKGIVSWQIAPAQIGIHKVRILAKDSQGAIAFQEFELNLAAPVAATPVGT